MWSYRVLLQHTQFAHWHSIHIFSLSKVSSMPELLHHQEAKDSSRRQVASQKRQRSIVVTALCQKLFLPRAATPAKDTAATHIRYQSSTRRFSCFIFSSKNKEMRIVSFGKPNCFRKSLKSFILHMKRRRKNTKTNTKSYFNEWQNDYNRDWYGFMFTKIMIMGLYTSVNIVEKWKKLGWICKGGGVQHR